MKQYDHKTVEGRAEIMRRLVKKVEKTMCLLYDRWQDERTMKSFLIMPRR